MVSTSKIARKSYKCSRKKRNCWINQRDKPEEEEIRKKLTSGKSPLPLRPTFYPGNKPIVKRI